MESVFHISNYAVENQVKFATCTFLRNALIWWNSHMKTVTQDVAYAIDWKTLKKMMIVKYCPRGEIKKLEIKLLNLKVKGTDVTSYTLRFQELALMCGRMFHEESDEVEKYVGGLPDMIRGNKRKLEFNAGNNQGNQQQNKRQNTRRAYTVGPGEKKEYTGSLPLCTKCNYHHKGPCAPRCNKCKKTGHLARDYRSSGPNGNNNNRGNSRTTQNAGTCYECGVQGHLKRDCLKLKNRNCGNQGGNDNAPTKVYVVGNVGTNPDSNVVTGTFLLNNGYASILFDTGADRSFVSTTFSSLIDITPTTLDHYYDVKLADEKIIGINTIIQGCTLNFLDHPFNINLIPVELGSFEVIIGMDWLAEYNAVIDYAGFTLLEFAQVLDIPCEGACVFTDGWRPDELAYGILSDGQYQTNLPSIEDIISENPEMENESYVLYDRVMTPLAAQLERKLKKDHGTRKGCHSTSSSSAFDQPFSSHLNDDDDDGNDEGTSRASTPSPIRYINSLTNQVPQVFQNPPNIDPHLEPFYTRQTEIINCQVQLRDEQRGRVRSIRKSLRRLWRNMKK
ncbi:reverse transcriptase domain-containing protein [Tanacetum coccineum]